MAAAEAAAVDGGALELSKENVVPLRAGRHGKGLSCAAGGGSRAAAARHREHMRLLRQSVLAYEGADPLAPWLVAIKWTKVGVAAA